MNTKLLVVLLLISVLFASTAVFAYKLNIKRELKLVQKDSVTWEPVENGAWGTAKGFMGKQLTFRGHKLDPETDFTLIYYGDETHNDEWPYATCLGSDTANDRGIVRIQTPVKDRGFMTDNTEQKIWLVLSSDVDCDAGEMTAWNPSEYLFETRAI